MNSFERCQQCSEVKVNKRMFNSFVWSTHIIKMDDLLPVSVRRFGVFDREDDSANSFNFCIAGCLKKQHVSMLLSRFVGMLSIYK